MDGCACVWMDGWMDGWLLDYVVKRPKQFMFSMGSFCIWGVGAFVRLITFRNKCENPPHLLATLHHLQTPPSFTLPNPFSNTLGQLTSYICPHAACVLHFTLFPS